MQYEPGLVRRNLPAIIAAVVLVAAFLSTAWLNSLFASAQDSVRAEISQAKANLELAEESNASKMREVQASAAGLSLERISDDSAMFADLLEDMCTWDSKESYDAMRERMISEHGVPEDSWLMQEFLPVVENSVNAEGHDIGNIIDNRGYNMSLADYDVRCMSANKGIYSYFAEAVVESGFKDQVGQSRCAFMFDVDAEGDIVSIDGMTATD